MFPPTCVAAWMNQSRPKTGSRRIDPNEPRSCRLAVTFGRYPRVAASTGRPANRDCERPIEEGRDPVNLGLELAPDVRSQPFERLDGNTAPLAALDLPRADQAAIRDDDRRHPAGRPVDAVVVSIREDALDPSGELVGERIEPREQTGGVVRLACDEGRNVAPEYQPARSFDVDFLDRLADRREGSRDAGHAAATPPARDHVPARTGKGGQVADDQAAKRLIGRGRVARRRLDRPAEPGRWLDERDVAPVRRPEDQV